MSEALLRLLNTKLPEHGPMSEIPPEVCRVIDERIAGQLGLAMQQHYGSFDRAIVTAMRCAYMQGFLDGSTPPGE